jgi:hypothetical protein
LVTSFTPTLSTIQMKRKNITEKFGLLISLIALLISIYSIVSIEKEKHLQNDITTKKAIYQSYRLGERFCAYYLAYNKTTKGDKNDIEEAKQFFLKGLEDVQIYSDLLDLRMNLKDIVVNNNSEDPLNLEIIDKFNERFSTLQYDRKVLASFKIGFLPVWLMFYSKLDKEIEYKNWFIKFYNEKILLDMNKSIDILNLDSKKLETKMKIDNILLDIENLRTSIEKFIK